MTLGKEKNHSDWKKSQQRKKDRKTKKNPDEENRERTKNLPKHELRKKGSSLYDLNQGEKQKTQSRAFNSAKAKETVKGRGEDFWEGNRGTVFFSRGSSGSKWPESFLGEKLVRRGRKKRRPASWKTGGGKEAQGGHKRTIKKKRDAETGLQRRLLRLGELATSEKNPSPTFLSKTKEKGPLLRVSGGVKGPQYGGEMTQGVQAPLAGMPIKSASLTGQGGRTAKYNRSDVWKKEGEWKKIRDGGEQNGRRKEERVSRRSQIVQNFEKGKSWTGERKGKKISSRKALLSKKKKRKRIRGRGQVRGDGKLGTFHTNPLKLERKKKSDQNERIRGETVAPREGEGFGGDKSCGGGDKEMRKKQGEAESPRPGPPGS